MTEDENAVIIEVLTARAEGAEAAVQRVREQLDWMAWLTQDERASLDHREGLKRFLDVIRAALDGSIDG